MCVPLEAIRFRLEVTSPLRRRTVAAAVAAAREDVAVLARVVAGPLRDSKIVILSLRGERLGVFCGWGSGGEGGEVVAGGALLEWLGGASVGDGVLELPGKVASPIAADRAARLAVGDVRRRRL